MATLREKHLVKASEQHAAELAAAARKFARRVRESEAGKPLQTSLRKVLTAALK